VSKHRRDMTARAGYSIVGSKPRTPQEMAAEYYAFDFEYAQTPEQTSWIASSWVSLSVIPSAQNPPRITHSAGTQLHFRGRIWRVFEAEPSLHRSAWVQAPYSSRGRSTPSPSRRSESSPDHVEFDCSDHTVWRVWGRNSVGEWESFEGRVYDRDL